MDGEHAFSAALTLVMVNVAFPYNEREAMALETALGILNGMAERGNEYIQARRKLLMDVLSTVGRRPYGDLNAGTETTVPNVFSNADLPQSGLPYLSQNTHPTQRVISNLSKTYHSISTSTMIRSSGKKYQGT